MKPALLTLLLVASMNFARAQTLTPQLLPAIDTFVQLGFYVFKPADYTTDPSKKFPVIIALSGAGEKGNGTTDLNKVFTSGIGYLVGQKKSHHAVQLSKWHAGFLCGLNATAGS